MKKPIYLLAFAILMGIDALYAQYDPAVDALAGPSRELRDLKRSDSHRPIYHFLCPDGYGQPFDPNGAIFWNGKYHLGYIYQRERAGKWEHLWGHAVSTDLLHWRLCSDMLTVGDADIERGIFSGGAFLSREGVPHVIYHGEGSSCNIIASSTDKDLQTWVKSDRNPVLRTPLEGDPMCGKYVAWDPEAWYDAKKGCYYQISGGNPATLFRSENMSDWQFLGELIGPDQRRNFDFEDVSCPDFFRIGDKQMLVFISHYLGAQYYIGRFADERFEVERYGRMNWPGGTFFAPEQLVDDRGRNIIWGWIIERKPPHLKNYGWSGILSLPRVLTLSKSGELEINPPEELCRLRINPHHEDIVHLQPNEEKRLLAAGRSLELQMEFKASDQTPYGVRVFASPDNSEQTEIRYEPAAGELVIDFSRSSAHGPVCVPKYCIMHYPPAENREGTVSEQRIPLRLGKGENLRLNIFIDHSVIEVFANGRQCATQVVYPELPESNGVTLFSKGGAVDVKNIDIWEMSATNLY